MNRVYIQISKSGDPTAIRMKQIGRLKTDEQELCPNKEKGPMFHVKHRPYSDRELRALDHRVTVAPLALGLR